MAINELQKQTNINIQEEKANLIWEIATHLGDCTSRTNTAK